MPRRIRFPSLYVQSGQRYMSFAGPPSLDDTGSGRRSWILTHFIAVLLARAIGLPASAAAGIPDQAASANMAL
jgi:hypothetical protein